MTIISFVTLFAGPLPKLLTMHVYENLLNNSRNFSINTDWYNSTGTLLLYMPSFEELSHSKECYIATVNDGVVFDATKLLDINNRSDIHVCQL